MSLWEFEVYAYMIMTLGFAAYFYTPFPYAFLPLVGVFILFMYMMKLHRKYILKEVAKVLADPEVK